MAERITTARPYAKAIFALARKAESLAATSTGLQRAASVVADPAVHDLLGNPARHNRAARGTGQRHRRARRKGP
jgi:F-type H+-transporting ATPase subunit delta